jgi:hypothetical protein
MSAENFGLALAHLIAKQKPKSVSDWLAISAALGRVQESICQSLIDEMKKED